MFTRGWKIRGWRWKTFGKHLWTKINTDDVLNRAAILSFYFLLALFPLWLKAAATWIFIQPVLATEHAFTTRSRKSFHRR